MTTQIEMSLPSVEWCNQAPAIVLRHFRSRDFTADDLHGVLPEPPHPNAYGNLIKHMSRRGLIELVCHVKAERKERNGSIIGKWRVRE